MNALRFLPVLALTLASLATSAMAQPHRGVGLPLDAELLPPNSGPGDCVVRRVTGPGGAYRWDRVECDTDRGWSDHDQWGYGNRRLDIETRQDPRGYQGGYEGSYGGGYAGDRYGAPRRESAYDRRVDQYEYEQVRAYGDGYDQGRGGPVVNYPPPYAYGYVAAGRDEAGYLIWPGKTP
ncbi:hypothetical protein [Caulobacter sp.]|uniref:hypothetical protein n=1 Tax=Caulobacter sp. TaxID=78 RepID=UPI001B2176EA|nr:hypothetical protein [Caulobacter sp.]MBO9547760.1 hypothetical protein [Caulobacter sp.]